VLAVGAFALAPSQAVSAANCKIDPARTHIAFAIDAVGYPRTQGVFRQSNGGISVDRTYGQKQRSGAIAVG
jgi:polyisoprenoid-binding protein YceI